jgi:hypothetical protein
MNPTLKRSNVQTFKRLTILVILALALGLTPDTRANPALPTDLSYSTETTWLLPGLPDLSAASGYIPHNFSHGAAIFDLGQEVIHGFRPGKVYAEMYMRDIAWGMETAQYYYPDAYLREPIEAFLRRQYTANTISLDGDLGVTAGAGAIGGIITPNGRSNKQTITTDEETSLIHAAYLYYNMTRNADWLHRQINGLSLIERLNRAADWLYAYRLDPATQLLWRGHTTDWGDVKFEKGPAYTDFNPTRDHKTASIYDQALAVMALSELAELNIAASDSAQAEEWRAKAEALKNQTNARLWQADKGIYLTHEHITPLEHPFDEASMVSISNALAVYAGLTDFGQSQAIFHRLEEARLAARVNKPGLSLYPFYPNQWPNLFFDYLGMGYGNYQNGGVWDWWGGVQIKAEFQAGFAEQGQVHLLQVANDWQKHPGNIIEWQSSTDPRHEGSHYYSAAAGTMGSAIIEGFFGIELDGQGLTLQPRLGLNDGYIRVYQAATDRYAAYTYDWGQAVTRLSYGTNAAEPVQVKVLKLRSEQISTVLVDGQPVDFTIEKIGHDTYTVFSASTGQHAIELVKGQSLAQPAALEVPASAPENPPTATPPPNVTPNPVAPPQATTVTELLPESPGDSALAAIPTLAPPPTQEALAAPQAPKTPAMSEKTQQTRYSFFRFVGISLAILTCLLLMILVALRRIVGLG